MHPAPVVPIDVTVDASDTTAGVTLQQIVKGQWQPLDTRGIHSTPGIKALTRGIVFGTIAVSLTSSIKGLVLVWFFLGPALFNLDGFADSDQIFQIGEDV